MVDGAKIVLIIRQLLEGILVIWGVYILSSKKLDKKVIYTGVLHGIFINILRALPISFGVHTILSLIITICLISIITKEMMIKVISNVMGAFIIVAFCDWASLFVYTNIFNVGVEQLLDGSVISSLYSLGPLFMMITILLLIKYIKGRTLDGYNR
ncbi:hypothetical protein [Anaeromicrobium sediminis]|uniref:Uncharacterized protein n=1 Tax=Anaeromicrobium sediminis TaxID=1478221 RepID=A0A267MFJ1_9FIRM|nr:hypothetical protein [Anaeromicrobium sediminis]PAB58227.1 hypothetical protein CCE28_16450 [Anaeromicrobium sediminis]